MTSVGWLTAAPHWYSWRRWIGLTLCEWHSKGVRPAPSLLVLLVLVFLPQLTEWYTFKVLLWVFLCYLIAISLAVFSEPYRASFCIIIMSSRLCNTLKGKYVYVRMWIFFFFFLSECESSSCCQNVDPLFIVRM